MVNLNDIKDHLQIEYDFNEYDVYLSSLLKAAHAFIQNHTNCVFIHKNESPPDNKRWAFITDDVELAMKMMIADWFNDREGSNSISKAAESLLHPYVEHGIG